MIRRLRVGGLLAAAVSGLAIASALTCPPAALAGTNYAWTGAGSSPNWSLGANWSGGQGLQQGQTYTGLLFGDLTGCDSGTSTGTCYASTADVPVSVNELSVDDNLPYRLGAANSAQVTLLGSAPGGSASSSTGIIAAPGSESPSGTAPVISAPIVIPTGSAQTWDIAGDSSGHQQSLEVDNINTSSPLDVNLTDGASLVTTSITGDQALSVSGGVGGGTTMNGILRFAGASGAGLDTGGSISLSDGASLDVATSGTVNAGSIDFADGSGGELTVGSGQAPDTVLSSDANVTFNSGIDFLALSLDSACPSSGCVSGADNSELTSSVGTVNLAGVTLALSQGSDSNGFCDDLAVGQTYTLVSAPTITGTFVNYPQNTGRPIGENCGLGPQATPSYVQLNYTSTAVTATVTAVGDAGDLPQNTGALPAISNKSRSGTSIIAGDTLFVTRGTWNESNSTDPQTKLSYNYVWMRCPASGPCTPIGGPSSSSYTTSASDVGDTIYVEVTATNTLGSKQVSSAKVGPVLPVLVPAATSPPTISGATTPGSILTVTSKGTWTGQPTPSYKYQWLLCSADRASSCAPAGAAGGTKTLTLTTADLGKYVAAAVSASNRGGTTLATSNLVGRVVPTRGAVLRALAWLRHPSSRKAIQALIAHLSFRTSFDAPSGGTLQITWKTTMTTGRGKHRRHQSIMVARGSARYGSLGPQDITVRLTRAGRTLLRHGRALLGHESTAVRITATERFQPTGGSWIMVSKHFTL
jgi:hypothetical protein